MPEYKHIVFGQRTHSLPYSTHGSGNFIKKRSIANRTAHGAHVRQAFELAVNQFSGENEAWKFVYLEFESAIDFKLDIARFENEKGDIRLASCTEKVTINDNGEKEVVYKAAVYLNKTAIRSFLEKVEEYLHKNTAKGNPKNESLIANIEKIRAATLESFWQEPEIPFPGNDQNVWWEVWINRESGATTLEQEILDRLYEAEVQIGSRTLVFPEHLVILVKGTSAQLGKSLLYTGQLAEIRKPAETADFFTYMDKEWQGRFIDDLNQRVVQVEDSNISVCLLDTGVNRTHPLLENLIPETNVDSIEPNWVKADTDSHGHGTPMAGLILYGDLTDAFASTGNIRIVHHLESVKILERTRPNDPDLYGKVTLEAISRGEIINPNNKRIACMAVTAPANQHLGRPSSWSSAIDQVLFGSINDRNNRTLILVSSGNLPLEARLESPLSNDDFSIEDPAQAFNALTIGSYTLKDRLDLEEFPGAELLARRGGMAPCNTTALCWENQWSRKPDIVLEGGNDGIFNGGICDPDSLMLLSTGKGDLGRSWLTTFGDTSASTALASKILAELYYEYPDLWPETIRGLIIHSAGWTPAMLNNRDIRDLSSEEQRKLLARVGYGVPNLKKALASAGNSLTLIAQRILTPYKYEGSRIQPKEFHLFHLPWPTDVLLLLAELQVTLTVTLSFFIEPNPGNKRYAQASTYRSYDLRFKMIDRNETETRFRARVSKAIRDEQEDYVAEGQEDWILGSQIRDKGSIHKDLWKGNAADLALRKKIAVYPVGGWWRYRKKLARYRSSVRYSLIVSIETGEQDIDIYTPVLNQVQIDYKIPIIN